MTTPTDGGPAFPHARVTRLPSGGGFPERDKVTYAPGLSRLDYFAAKAMQGEIAAGAEVTKETAHELAEWCFDLAAAMLAESERRGA